jgi:hypothetical protein
MLCLDQRGEQDSHVRGLQLEANHFEVQEAQSQLSEMDDTQSEQVRECRGWTNKYQAVLRLFLQDFRNEYEVCDGSIVGKDLFV